MEAKLTNMQYTLLSDIFGPPPEVHMMIMTANKHGSSWIIEGDKSSFNSLSNIIYEELELNHSNQTKERQYFTILNKIQPDEEIINFLS